MIKTEKITAKITIKDIADMLEVSLPTAQRYYRDIKQEYNLKIVTLHHFNLYFGFIK